MVRAFFIQTLKQGQWRILYSRFYGPDAMPTAQDKGIFSEEHDGIYFSPNEADDDNDDTQTTQVPKDVRTGRLKTCRTVCTKIQEAYSFRLKVTNRNVDQELKALLNEGIMPGYELGFFRLADSSCSSHEGIVIWMGALDCCFSLLLDKYDNRLTAETVLTMLVNYVHRYCEAFSKPQELVHRLDKVTVILEQFLPMGQLNIMNHRVVRQLVKELEAKMKVIG